MTSRLASEHTIHRSLVSVLSAGPLTARELVARLREDGLSLDSDGFTRVVDGLEASSLFVELDRERWACTMTLLEGITWITRLTQDDAAADEIPLDEDLFLLGWYLLDEPARLATGAELDVDEREDGTQALVGPRDWLVGLAPGLVGVRLDHDVIAVEAVADPCEPAAALVEALRTAFVQHAQRDEVRDLLAAEDEPPQVLVRIGAEELLWEAVADLPEAFKTAPVPPLADLFAAAGLERRGYAVAEQGFDWTALDVWHHDQRLASTFGLTEEQVLRFKMLKGAEIAVSLGDPHPIGPPEAEEGGALLLTACLHDDKVARAFWGHHLGEGTPPERLITFADRLLVHVDDVDEVAATVRWLRARALDQAGRPLEAERELTLAVASGADLPLAQRALAAFCADRGDARRAVALLRQAGAGGGEEEVEDPGDELMDEVAGWAAHRPRPAAGRNDLCPCGSGRKYKTCHLGKEQHPLLERGAWLYAKARRYLRDGRHRELGAELAGTVAEASGRGGYFLLDLLDSELVADLALCKAGVFDDFVAERHELLPDDEAMLAGRWQLAERSLFEVEQVEHDLLRLRDVRTGDRVVVTNTRMNRATAPGTYLMGRPLPVADTWRAYSGFVSVVALVDEALAVLDRRDPFELAALVGRCLAPPVMQNTDGQELVFHDFTYQVGDVNAARVTLERALSTNGDDIFSLVRDSQNQANTVVLQFRLEGDQLRVEANSDERASEAQALVRRLLPDAVLVDHDLRDLDEVMSEADPGRASTEPDVPGEVMEQIIREFEDRWLREPVPALGGLTPREAAADPVRRADLERLLRQLDGRPGTMDLERLRSELLM